MTDLARCLCFKKCFKCAALGDHLIEILLGGVVHLIKVDIVGAEVAKAYIDILRHSLLRARHTFGRENEFLTHSLERVSEVFFTYGITARGVDEVDTLVYKIADESFCALGIDLLDRNAAKTEARYFKSCFSENFVFHNSSPKKCI